MVDNNVNIQVRKAYQKDFQEICSLINNEIGYKSVKLNDLSSRLKTMNQDKNYFTFVAIHNEKVIGFIGLMKFMTYEFNGLCMRILSIAVAKDFQKKGVGKYLLGYAENFAIISGVDLFMVGSEMNLVNAHKFYENNGYKKSSYGFWKMISNVEFIER